MYTLYEIKKYIRNYFKSNSNIKIKSNTNNLQRLVFEYKKIDAITHQLIINGASEGNLPNPFIFLNNL